METNETFLEGLNDYLFHYNPYNETWSAFKREDSNSYFNGDAAEDKVIRSSSFSTLVNYITTTQI